MKNQGGTPSKTDESSAASLVSFVVDSIVEGVLKGQYVPGQRLIAADLAEEYGVSRAPVREALHVLAGEGVVELIANRGARIRKLGVEQLFNFLEFTEALLAVGVRRVTNKKLKRDEIALIEKAFQDIEQQCERKNARELLSALHRYHTVLNKISGNDFVEFFYNRPYIRFYTSLIHEFAPGDNWTQFIHNYRLIHSTILSGDEHTSVATFVAHIRWVLQMMRG
ncbi:GntR family transcriptional regulator [Sphingobium chungbukense]|uniref:GntR family transcriptional regulator n=1 Tax=Sphingobium chungbukense TaxID=56193 RepID=UPI0009FBD945|nr:GntR family transcriptional regulator [Sphingobium chungbukense]